MAGSSCVEQVLAVGQSIRHATFLFESPPLLLHEGQKCRGCRGSQALPYFGVSKLNKLLAGCTEKH